MRDLHVSKVFQARLSSVKEAEQGHRMEQINTI